MSTDEVVGQSRRRILDAALALMSEHGASGTSMRQLAEASELNVATLYHYFPSKSDLFRAVLAERGYLERLRTDTPPADLAAEPDARRRLAGLVTWLWEASGQEESVWRLIIGESMRGDAGARTEATVLVQGMEVALTGWVAEVVPELADRAATVARLVRTTLFSLMVEQLALGADPARAGARTADLVDAVLPA